MKYLLIASLFLMQNVFAANCSDLNLVTQPNSPFQKIPVMDQDGIGICYAYVAAQLMDYEIVKSGQPRSVHPLWAALKYSESKNKDSISNGITYFTVDAILKAGNCQYDSVSNALSVWARKANVKEAEIMNLIEKFAPKLQTFHNTVRTTNSPEVTQAEIDRIIAEAIEEHKPYCSPNATWDQILPELRSLSVMSSRKMLASLILPVCNTNIPKPRVPGPQFYFTDKDENWLTEIEDKLDNLNSPVSISYCSKVLSEPAYTGVEGRNIKTNQSTFKDGCGPHESLIVGKKKIAGSCHLLLRNTWGNGFSDATKNWKCLCKHKTTGAMVDECTNDTHNNGYYTVEGCWIDAKALTKNTFGATYLGQPAKKRAGKRK